MQSTRTLCVLLSTLTGGGIHAQSAALYSISENSTIGESYDRAEGGRLAPTGGKLALRVYKSTGGQDSKGAFLSGTTVTLLPRIAGADYAAALSTNGTTFCGRGNTSAGNSIRAALWPDASTVYSVFEPNSQLTGWATDINQSGRLVFHAQGGSSPQPVAYWRNEGSPFALVELLRSGYAYSKANGINASSVIGGEVFSNSNASDRIPCYWTFNPSLGDYNAPTQLAGWPTGRRGTIIDVSDNGFLVGYADPSTGPFGSANAQPFRYEISTGTLEFIGEPGITGMPSQVNSAGKVVGNGPHPWVWLPSASPWNGAVLDLKAFTSPNTTVALTLTGIDDTATNPLFGGHDSSNAKAFLTTIDTSWTRRTLRSTAGQLEDSFGDPLQNGALTPVFGQNAVPPEAQNPTEGDAKFPDAQYVRFETSEVPAGAPSDFSFALIGEFDAEGLQFVGVLQSLSVKVTTRTTLPSGWTEHLYLAKNTVGPEFEWVRFTPEGNQNSRTFRTLEANPTTELEKYVNTTLGPGTGRRVIKFKVVAQASSSTSTPANWQYDVDQARCHVKVN